MSNYYGTGRSNYFKVKDGEAFTKWAEALDLEVITDPNGVGFLVTDESGDVPNIQWNEELQDDIEVDFFNELAAHLLEDEVAIFIHSGNDKAKYVGGVAVAVNSKGETKVVTLDSIYELAKELGKNITTAEY